MAATLGLAFLVAVVLAFKVRGSSDPTVSRTSAAREDTPREVTQIGLGGSIVEAQVIEQRLKAQAVREELEGLGY